MKFAYAEHIQLFENVNEATSVNELTTLVKLFSLVQPQFYIWRDQGGVVPHYRGRICGENFGI